MVTIHSPTKELFFNFCLLYIKCTNNVAPSYLTELLSKYLPTRTLRPGNMELFGERKSNRTWGDRSFAIAAPRLWNELPFNNCKDCKKYCCFQKKKKKKKKTIKDTPYVKDIL